MWAAAFLTGALLMEPLPNDNISQWEQRLCSDDYTIRRAAEKDLIKRDSLELCRRLHKNRDPEIRLRSGSLYFKKKEDLIAGLKPYPRLCSLWFDPKEMRYDVKGSFRDEMWCKYMRKIFNEADLRNKFGPWPEYGFISDCDCYKAGTRRWLEDAVDSGVAECYIRAIIKEMRKRDDLYYDSKTMSYVFRP